MEKKKTKIMGILNVTPDSFYDGGRFFDINKAVNKGVQMHKDGADIIDVGGESTRPFSKQVSESVELERVIPVIKELQRKIPGSISIDTMKPKVAIAAIEAGASIINDVSGFRNSEMIAAAKGRDVQICVMHMLNNPKAMQKDPYYEEGIIDHLLAWMKERSETLISTGIKKENIIFDPGIGFGKTVDDNIKILQNLLKLKCMGFPLLIGLSRKSFMGKIVDKSATELLSTSIALNTYAMLEGVEYIRVHDVLEHSDALKVINRL